MQRLEGSIDLPQLMIGLCPNKHIISCKYHKLKVHLIPLTYPTP